MLTNINLNPNPSAVSTNLEYLGLNLLFDPDMNLYNYYSSLDPKMQKIIANISHEFHSQAEIEEFVEQYSDKFF